MLKFRVVKSNNAAIKAAILTAIAESIGKTADTIVARSEQGSPVDTGSEQGGFYAKYEGHNGYAAAAARASSLNPKAHILDEAPDPVDRYHALVSHAPEHTIYQELGTPFMSAQPTMVPAAESVRQTWLDDLVNGINAAIRAAG